MENLMREAVLREVDRTTEEIKILRISNALTGSKTIQKMIDELQAHLNDLYRKLESNEEMPTA